MRRVAYIMALLLAGSTARADWSWVNAWDHQRWGKTYASECYQAISQRCEIIDAAIVSKPTWYRFQRTNLRNDKTKLESIITSFINTNRSNGTDFDAYFASVSTGDTTVLSFPMLTVTGALVNAGLPINYLDYTPWRCLNGLGPFTNDTTVGHAYGWTNAYTAAGGTNFPGSRTNWYSTDFTWQGIKALMQQLVWTWDVTPSSSAIQMEKYCTLATDGGITTITNCCYPPITCGRSTNYSVMKDIFYAYYADPGSCMVTNHNRDLGCSYSYNTGFADTPFSMIAGSVIGIVGGSFEKTGIHTNYSHAAQCYVVWGSYCGSNTYCDFFDVAPLEKQPYLLESFSAATTTNRITAKYMPNVLLGISSSRPDGDDDRDQESRAVLWLFKWDVANGFTYK